MKKKILIIGIIIVIIVTILGISIWKITSNKQDKNENSEEFIQEEQETVKKDVFVEYNIDETWQDGENTALKYTVKIINNSKEDVSNWNIVFDVNETTQISQFWNTKLELKDSKINAIPETYNNTIQKDNQIEFGMILLDNQEEAVNGYKLFIDGVEYMGKKEEKVEDVKVENNVSQNEQGTPVDVHGKLSIKGKNIVDKNNENFIIQGVSTHGIAWFPQYVNLDTFKTLRDEFNVNTIRLAMYSDSNAGYKAELHTKVSEGVQYAKELGMYVIIDWHILGDNNPNQNKEKAITFFTEMANKYKDDDNVIYEICNEPNGNVTWDKDVKPYAEEVIDVIKKIDNDAIIIVGTPTWSQDVDIASKNPITGYDNIVYALHFYAATHKQDLRNKLQTALDNNLPVLVSEFGICDASGNGKIDEEEANKWISTLKENGIGYVCWNLSNKDESSSILKSTTNSISNWKNEELSEEGLWLKNTYNK